MLSSIDMEELQPTPLGDWPSQQSGASEKLREESRARLPETVRLYEYQWVGEWSAGTHESLTMVAYHAPWPGKLRQVRSFRNELQALRESYMLRDGDPAMNKLLEEEAGLFQVLRDAVAPLEKAFGEKSLLYLGVQEGEDDRLLKLTVHLPAGSSEEQAARTLDMFDDDWWLKNCHRAGALVIDYEIEDGV
jgi:hypothetical protein